METKVLVTARSGKGNEEYKSKNMVMLETLSHTHLYCSPLFDKGSELEKQTITTTIANIPTHHHHHCPFTAPSSPPPQDRGKVIVRLDPAFSVFGFNYLLFLADSPVAAIGVYVFGPLSEVEEKGFSE